ncbi:hypothetical protein C1H46_007216 [Malus baccata]|uniref:Uncharacterized protein n=1 Tax=Malus baccata TaxID=106549 RepID=A0A540N9C1_MALBA|nr:hypothetical protein C1H46_007216 [Malus baccata]
MKLQKNRVHDFRFSRLKKNRPRFQISQDPWTWESSHVFFSLVFPSLSSSFLFLSFLAFILP